MPATRTRPAPAKDKRDGKHGAKNAKQAIAVGVTKERTAPTRPAAAKKALKTASKKTTVKKAVGKKAVAAQSSTAASKPAAASPSAAARKAVGTKAPAVRKAAAKKTAAPAHDRALRLATFNINGIRSRLPHLLQWLAQEKPDIVCLQELKAADTAFPRQELEAAGYGCLWKGQTSWNGVAILARDSEPVPSRIALPGDPKDTQSRYLEAAVHGIYVACLYLPNGNPRPGPKFDYKLAWFERLIKHAKNLQTCGHPVALAGDFNVVPTDFDIYNPKSWRRDALLQPETRHAYERLLAQGWIDTLRTVHPKQPMYTFWDYFRDHWPRDAGLRIDHILLNKTLAPRLAKAGVDRWVRDLTKASDHAPVWITLTR